MKLGLQRFRYLLVVAAILLLSQCGQKREFPEKKLIVCTTGFVADLVTAIASDDCEIICLMGPGVDPHLYKASLRDVDYLANADLIVYSGLHLEGKMTELLAKVGKSTPTINISNGLNHQDPITLDNKGTHDPHFWFDPYLWKKASIYFEHEYKQLGWSDTNQTSIRLHEYTNMLSELDLTAKKAVAQIPTNQRYLVTPHDAFGYFCRRYHLEVKSLQGISTVAEYGIRDVTDLIQFLVDNKIPTVFIESSISPKSIEAILAGCAAKNHTLKIGGELFSDALGAADTPESSYKGVFLHNLNHITKGLKDNTK